MAFDSRLRSPKEIPLFRIGVVISVLVYLVLIITVVGAFYGAIGLAFVLVVQAMFLAHVHGNGLRVSESQLPELYARCKASAARLGLEETPEIYVLQSSGVLNAFATRFLSRRFVIIYSSLIDSCHDPRQLDFVIGHEMGHLAAGHLKYRGFLLPLFITPWLGMAYSRACEYTSDRCGLLCTDGIEPALRGLAVLAAGGKQAQLVDLAAFTRQQEETGGFWASVYELGSTHPYLCKRALALEEFTRPGSTRVTPRHPLAYPLAPVFGLAHGGAGGSSSMLMVVAMMGVLAAIAIPNFIKLQERTKARAAAQQRYRQPPPDDDSTADAPTPR